jgi:hypothetical protein
MVHYDRRVASVTIASAEHRVGRAEFAVVIPNTLRSIDVPMFSVGVEDGIGCVLIAVEATEVSLVVLSAKDH